MTPAAVVLLFLLARGYLGGFKSSDADTFLEESKTLAVFLAHNGLTLCYRASWMSWCGSDSRQLVEGRGAVTPPMALGGKFARRRAA